MTQVGPNFQEVRNYENEYQADTAAQTEKTPARPQATAHMSARTPRQAHAMGADGGQGAVALHLPEAASRRAPTLLPLPGNTTIDGTVTVNLLLKMGLTKLSQAYGRDTDLASPNRPTALASAHQAGGSGGTTGERSMWATVSTAAT